MVVATQSRHPYLFKIFDGDELYPLSFQRIHILWDEYGFRCDDYRNEFRKRLIRNWDQLLASPARDFLLSSNGDQVPISSLKGKLIGLYFCENVPHPPSMELIKKAYQEAKLRGYDFEIVHINFYFHCFGAVYRDADLSERQRYKSINWLTLPFKDLSCKKLQGIFQCQCINPGYDDIIWKGDCLVIINSRLHANNDVISADEVLFEFSGAKIIKKYGIEGYTFARQTLFEIEYTRQKKEIKLQSYFPPGLCNHTRAVGDGGFDLVNASQLKGKRVLVLFAHYKDKEYYTFISMLKSRYLKQAEEDKFEVVSVSTNDSKSNCINMPWLVYPYSPKFEKWCSTEILRAAAFDIDGQLITKDYLYSRRILEHKTHRFFPFFSHDDLIEQILDEVKEKCQLNDHYYSDGE